MAQQIPPNPQFDFQGLVLTGHPLNRPATSATKCQDFRIMPGNWPRLRGGRRARMYQSNANAKFMQFVTLRSKTFTGGEGHLVQFFDGTNSTWEWLKLGQSYYAFSRVGGLGWYEPISGQYDNAFANTNQAAATQLDFGVVLYNGLGVRDASGSQPPFTAGDSESAMRYFGLDAYCPDGNPTAAFTAGAGSNAVTTRVDIYVGLHNTATQHFSNGVYVGTIQTTAGAGTINVTNLDRLKANWHNLSEQMELKYVFYATVDGARVPYLVMDESGILPFTVGITNTSASLSLAPGTFNGWYLNYASEMPTTNFPPRPMRSLAYVGGRLYGILMDGGHGDAVLQSYPDPSSPTGFNERSDFKYASGSVPGIVFSAAYGDAIDQDLLGRPLECWPLSNFSPTPNAEIPLKVAAGPDGKTILVLTPSAAFVVLEAADGIHEWTRISPLHGILNAAAFCETPHGCAWVTQRNELVLLDKSLSLSFLSQGYQPTLNGKTVRALGYILDPRDAIDRIEVYLSDGTAVVHDFAIGGQGYTSANHDYTAALSVSDHHEEVHHLAANRHLFTREVQPYGEGIPTSDQDYDGSGNVVTRELTGEITGQWRNFGDANLRKELPWVDVIGDPNASVAWWKDLQETSDNNRMPLSGEKTPQSDTDLRMRFKLKAGSAFWYKFQFKLVGRSGEKSVYELPADQSALASSLYGAIALVETTVSGSGGNRP